MATEFTRADLDRYLPDDQYLRRRVEAIAGFRFGSDDHMVIRGLEWLSNKTESERTPAVPWTVQPWNMPRGVFFAGLWFKPSWGEMPEEGWGKGDRCWLANISCGRNCIITGLTPAVVIARSMVVMELAIEWRDTDPAVRVERLVDLIEAKIERGTWR